MIEITSATAPPPVVDLARLRAVVPRYQWTEITVRLWGERSRDRLTVLGDAPQGREGQGRQRSAVVTTCAAAATSYAFSPAAGGTPSRTTSVPDPGSTTRT